MPPRSPPPQPIRLCANETGGPVSACTPASTAARNRSGGSAAVAAEITAIVSRTARTSSSKASATVVGAAASCRSMAARSLSEMAFSA